jgi:hypothetical protein
MVDMHQDVFEGFPDFYATNDMLKHHCTGSVMPWFWYMFGLCKPMANYTLRYD